MVMEDKEVLLDKDTIIVSETDKRGIVTYANDDFCKICGYSKDELIGKPHNIVRHPDMPKAAFRDLWETIENGDVWSGIVKNLTKDGSFYWVKATVYSSNGQNNEPRYFSVRVKPTEDDIKEAELLYETLS